MQTVPTPTTTTQPPEDGPEYVVQRPPPGLARGRYAVPAWLVAVIAVALVAAIVTFFVWRRRRHERSRRYESVGPSSAPPSSRPPSSRR